MGSERLDKTSGNESTGKQLTPGEARAFLIGGGLIGLIASGAILIIARIINVPQEIMDVLLTYWWVLPLFGSIAMSVYAFIYASRKSSPEYADAVSQPTAPEVKPSIYDRELTVGNVISGDPTAGWATALAAIIFIGLILGFINVGYGIFRDCCAMTAVIVFGIDLVIIALRVKSVRSFLQRGILLKAEITEIRYWNEIFKTTFKYTLLGEEHKFVKRFTSSRAYAYEVGQEIDIIVDPNDHDSVKILDLFT